MTSADASAPDLGLAWTAVAMSTEKQGVYLPVVQVHVGEAAPAVLTSLIYPRVAGPGRAGPAPPPPSATRRSAAPAHTGALQPHAAIRRRQHSASQHPANASQRSLAGVRCRVCQAGLTRTTKHRYSQ